MSAPAYRDSTEETLRRLGERVDVLEEQLTKVRAPAPPPKAKAPLTFFQVVCRVAAADVPLAWALLWVSSRANSPAWVGQASGVTAGIAGLLSLTALVSDLMDRDLAREARERLKLEGRR